MVGTRCKFCMASSLYRWRDRKKVLWRRISSRDSDVKLLSISGHIDQRCDGHNGVRSKWIRAAPRSYSGCFNHSHCSAGTSKKVSLSSELASQQQQHRMVHLNLRSLHLARWIVSIKMWADRVLPKQLGNGHNFCIVFSHFRHRRWFLCAACSSADRHKFICKSSYLRSDQRSVCLKHLAFDTILGLLSRCPAGCRRHHKIC